MVFSELMVFSEVLDEQMVPMVFFEAHSPFEQKMIFVAAMAFVLSISLPLGMNSLIVSFLLFHETAAAYSRCRDHHQDHLLNRNLLMTTIFSCQLNYFVIIVWDGGAALPVIDDIDQLIYYFETIVWAALTLPLVMIQAFVHLLAPDTTFLSSVHGGTMILYVIMVAV